MREFETLHAYLDKNGYDFSYQNSSKYGQSISVYEEEEWIWTAEEYPNGWIVTYGNVMGDNQSLFYSANDIINYLEKDKEYRKRRLSI